MGWGTYFAFILSAINTMVVTYYLAIKDLPALKVIFPTFLSYLGIVSMIGVPLLIVIGYVHYKKIAAFSSEVAVIYESNPYTYKLNPGFNVEVVFPLYVMITQMMVRWSKNEKPSEEDLKQLYDLQKKIEILLAGGTIGKPKNIKGW